MCVGPQPPNLRSALLSSRMSARSARVGGGRTNEAAATAGARSMSGPETKPETKTTARKTGRAHANQYNRKFAEVHK